MRLDFETMDETVIRGFYGGQRDTLARNVRGRIQPDHAGRIGAGGLHWPPSSQCRIVLPGGEEEGLSPGKGRYCPKGHARSLGNTGDADLGFLCRGALPIAGKG